MFADFQCPFCKRVQPTLDEIIAAYPGKVCVVFRHLPLRERSSQGWIGARVEVQSRASQIVSSAGIGRRPRNRPGPRALLPDRVAVGGREHPAAVQ
ncbi:DsbA family protein [Sorangium sp. So ce1389]|uniref:DsbA family protein n=1 Tax=Sorangium sp. So ce1389 TaxID=3133336 RepID=UPI003F607839